MTAPRASLPTGLCLCEDVSFGDSGILDVHSDCSSGSLDLFQMVILDRDKYDGFYALTWTSPAENMDRFGK